MATSFTARVGKDVSDYLIVAGSVGVDATSISQVYIKSFFAVDANESNRRFSFSPSDTVGVTYEERYELPKGSPWRVEVNVTAGMAGYPVSCTVEDVTAGTSQSVSGFTNETLAVAPAA